MGSSLSVKFKEYFHKDLWDSSQSENFFLVRIINKILRIGYLVLHGFLNDQCMIRASALTFTTMLSIVPFLAVAFSIAKGMGAQDSQFIHDILLKISAGREEVVLRILEYINNTNVKTLGWIGMGTLLFTVLSTVGAIEKAFNLIWKVKKGRTFWRKFTDFFSVTLICPVAVILATSISVTVKQQVVVSKIETIYGMSILESGLIYLAPFLTIWIAFTFIYAFMPNTKVRISAALIGGIVAGTIWQTAQWAYINWQIGVSKYNAIYGSFAQLPLFLLWLYISWIIVLLGAEIAYGVQNVVTFRQSRLVSASSIEDLQKFSLLALSVMSRRFEKAEPPYSVEELSEKMGIPVSFITTLFEMLVDEGLLVSGNDLENNVYAFAVTPERITVTYLLGSLSSYGGGIAANIKSPEMDFVNGIIKDIKTAIMGSGKDLTLKDCGKLMEETLGPIS